MMLARQPLESILAASCDIKPTRYDNDHGNIFPQASESEPFFGEPVPYGKIGSVQP